MNMHSNQDKATYRQSLKFRRREREEYPLIYRIIIDPDTKEISLEVEVKRLFRPQYEGTNCLLALYLGLRCAPK